MDGATTAGARRTRVRRGGSGLRLSLWLLAHGLGVAAAGFAVASVLWVLLYRAVDPPGTMLMAEERARLGAVAADWAPLAAISPDLRRSVIAAEDARFCQHWGFDLAAIIQAVRAAGAGEKLRGASTISQQTAKNVFLWADRSWLRKGLEVWFTGLIETFWPKRRILEVYLNVAEFGEGVFGVEAASRRAFGRPAADLPLWMATRLVVALPAPRERDPAQLGEELALRADQVADGARTLEADGGAACVTR